MSLKTPTRKVRQKRFTSKVNLEGKTMVLVYRSNKNLLAQVYSDQGKALFSATSAKIKDKTTKTEKSLSLAKLVANFLTKNKLTKNIVFNRNGYIYHGRVKAFAEELRNQKIAI